MTCTCSATPEVELYSIPDIWAKVSCRDGSYVILRYFDAADSWCILGRVSLYIPLHDKSNSVHVLTQFINGTMRQDGKSKYMLVDADNGRPSYTCDDPQTIRSLIVKNVLCSTDRDSFHSIFSFNGSMQYTPYDEDEHASVVRWFGDCAQLILNRVGKELIAQAGVRCTEVTIGSSINMDCLKCVYKTHTVYKSRMGFNVDIIISFWEQPDFYVDKVNITFGADNQTPLGCSSPSNSQTDWVIHLLGHEVHFINTSNCELSGNAELRRQIIEDMQLEPDSYLEDDMCQFAYFMLVNKSINFIEYIRQQLLEAVVKGGNDQLYKHTNFLITQIAEQLKQYITKQF